ncbi:MAG: YkgJ family cysteine cluster protein [Leptospirillia bacterium]
MNDGSPADLVHDLTFSNYRKETFTLPVSVYRESMEALSKIANRVVEEGGRVEESSAREMVREVYRIVDRVGKSVESFMSCRASCAACCRMMVGVTRGEGEILRERFRSEAAGPRKDRWLPLLAARSEDLHAVSRLAPMVDPEHPLSSLEDMLATCEAYEELSVTCPFLGEDRLCQIYEERPLMCRICWTLTDPRDCDPGEGPPVKFRNGVFFRAFELVEMISRAGFGDGRRRPIPLWLTEE